MDTELIELAKVLGNSAVWITGLVIMGQLAKQIIGKVWPTLKPEIKATKANIDALNNLRGN